MAPSVDWAAISLFVATHVGDALFVVDAEGVVKLATQAAESKLGWGRDELLGRPWLGTLTDDPDEAAKVTFGGARAFEHPHKTTLKVRSRDGHRWAIDAELRRVGHSSGAVVAGRIVAARSLDLPTSRWREGDFEYCVSLAPFGDLKWAFHFQTRERLTGASLGRCFELFAGKATPCSDCPAAGGSSWSRIVTRTSPGPDSQLELVSARPSSAHPGCADVSVRRLPPQFMGALFEARTAEVAARANLSEREQSVLRYLVMGRALQDISTILGISVRTVKFHQANVLEKLGADSRVDLLRLIL